MNVSDSLDMRGRLTLQKFDTRGQLLEEIKANNSIVYTGRDLVAKLFLNVGIKPISHVAVGTGAGEVDPFKDELLKAEVYRIAIKPVDLSKQLMDYEETVTANGSTTTQKTVRRKVIISADLPETEPQGEPWELREAGLFNEKEPNKGVMYNRVVFPTVTKTKDFKLTLVWEIIF
jgi:hypothetical protein